MTIDSLERPNQCVRMLNCVQEYWRGQAVRDALTQIRAGPDGERYFGGNEWLQFWIDEAQRVLAPGYTPTAADMLKLRRPTSGVVELAFTMTPDDGGNTGAQDFVLVDVGGQTHEMKSWEGQLNAPGLCGIVFMANLAGFARRGERRESRLLDDLALLDKCLAAFPAMQALPIAVMLNKRDLFEAALEKGPAKGKFHHYVKECPRDVAKGSRGGILKWLAGEVEKGNEGAFVSADHGAITCFASCATDTDQAQDMIDQVFDAILTNQVQNSLM